MRIVSLLPAATEIVYALGLGEHLVGRSHECDFPPAATRLPVCSRPKFVADGRSYAIHQQVLAIVQEALGIYQVDGELLERLQPTHIITQTQCDVCAVSERELVETTCRLLSSQPELIGLEPNDLAAVWQDLRRIGQALSSEAAAERLIAALQERMQVIAATTTALPEQPRVACIEWIEPLMGAGNWMPELVMLAGGRHLFGEAGQHSPWLTWDELAAHDPDVILIAPCGFGLRRALDESRVLTHMPGWCELRAVRTGRAVVADGHQYFNRPGPRLVESLEILAEVCHPQACHFGHQGTGWLPLPLPAEG